ncbi:MAG: NAD-dependent protein deacylase [Eggerthellaceae bacterium]|nr:NAD-dependent protein deacylase [Eggerthellaceae bacterium]
MSTITQNTSSNAVETLRTWIAECPPQGMVFFGGAGVSTESGIPDFRSAKGIFLQDLGKQAAEFAERTDYPQRAKRLANLKLAPEQVVSRTFFDEYPAEFYAFYCDKMIFTDAQPNAAHRKLAQLEEQGILRAVVTQNIDGLHQAAGSKNVFELHGSVLRNFCMRCHAPYSLDEMLTLRETSEEGIPRCPECGGIIKPDVVLYEEGLDMNVLEGAIDAITRASLLVIAGTSLVVNPAASLIHYFHGEHLAIVNLSPTSADKLADLVIAEPVGKVFDF